jgi:hypothetical protein
MPSDTSQWLAGHAIRPVTTDGSLFSLEFVLHAPADMRIQLLDCDIGLLVSLATSSTSFCCVLFLTSRFSNPYQIKLIKFLLNSSYIHFIADLCLYKFQHNSIPYSTDFLCSILPTNEDIYYQHLYMSPTVSACCKL